MEDELWGSGWAVRCEDVLFTDWGCAVAGPRWNKLSWLPLIGLARYVYSWQVLFRCGASVFWTDSACLTFPDGKLPTKGRQAPVHGRRRKLSRGYNHGIREGYTCLARDSQVSKFRKKDSVSILSPDCLSFKSGYLITPGRYRLYRPEWNDRLSTTDIWNLRIDFFFSQFFSRWQGQSFANAAIIYVIMHSWIIYLIMRSWIIYLITYN